MAQFIILNEETKKAAIDFIRNLAPDKKWVCEIKKKTKKRSLSQNALMWMWLNDVAKQMSDITGYDQDEMHAVFKKKFLVPRIVRVDDVEVDIYSTKNLTTKEFTEYLERIDRFCAQEFGIHVPHPQDMQLRQ